MHLKGFKESKFTNSNFEYGRWLSSPPPGEEVVITGVSGRLPESNNIHEFRDNLFTKKDMVTNANARWKLDHHDLPKRHAVVHNIDLFDGGYFGLHHRQAATMDPALRVHMETVIESIMDAGINPMELKGSKTGVFIGGYASDVENCTFINMKEPHRFAVTGYVKSMYAHRISYLLKLKGPSVVADTACSSSANALHTAFQSIRSGQCDNAIVASCNLTLHPGSTIQFYRMGVLSDDGVPKVFDQEANGYVRAEAFGCIFLQKSKNAKRIYAKIINIKSNSDGFKKEGITFPSSQMQKELMIEVYEESNIDPSRLSYLEAHGTGTQAGDPEEVNAIDNALAKKCKKQLLVGSVKSNIGHSEPISGICSIIKVLIVMETGFIVPNINFKTIRTGLEGIEQKRMKVVTELTELPEEDAIVGINNFGFGGSNCHLILQRFEKHKINSGLPKDDIPRLICVSGRTANAVSKMLLDVSKKKLDAEYIGLLHQLYKLNTPNHLYRGYAIVSKHGVSSKSSVSLACSQPPLEVYFGLFLKNFRKLAFYMMHFPAFKDALLKINEILEFNKVKKIEEILDSVSKPYEDVLGSICIQLVMVDILKNLGLQPSNTLGDSYGKIVSAYYSNIISLKQAVSAALHISRVNFDSNMNLEALQQMETGKLNGEHYCKNDTQKKIIINISDSSYPSEDNLLVRDGTVNLLDILGRLYTVGYLPQIHKLYPEVEFPVSRGTAMISPSIKWYHRKPWHVFKFSKFTASDIEQTEYGISYMNDKFEFIRGHVIDDRNLFPATEYLNLVWQTFVRSRHLLVIDMPVIFENCKFIRAVTMPASGFVRLLVMIQKGTGNFEILEKNSLIVTGRIRMCENTHEQQINVTAFSCFDDDRLKSLEQDEIYREFYLRGYNYSGQFKAIKKCKVDEPFGLIQWNDNWGAFMDNMLQLKILYTDTRLLYVPVSIKKIIIDPARHLDIVSTLDENECILPAFMNENMIKSGGIEIHGLQVKSIFKKKPQLEPVLEKNQFIPNTSSLELEEAVRVNTQIILENNSDNLFKAVEIIDEYTTLNSKHLLSLVYQALEDIPLVTPDLTISSKTNIVEENPGIKFENITLTPESNLLLIVGSNLLQRPTNLKQILISLNKNGFILTREKLDITLGPGIDEMEVITNYITPNERVVLLRKKVKTKDPPKLIEISASNFDWIPELQKSMKLYKNIIIYAKNEEPEGILGLLNCIRRETNGNAVKCFLMMDKAPEFNPQHSFYNDQIDKNFAVNIYKNNTWGTYRHLRLETVPKINCEHPYAYFKNRGDISSFEWWEGPLSKEVPIKNGNILALASYAAVNFKDIMAASGRVNPETITSNRLEQELLVGFEFSGVDLSGRRIAGMIDTQGISSYVTVDSYLSWEVPHSWTLEDAATVPVVYSTVIYALLMQAKMKPGSSILIHSATGGIGLAALNVCFYYKCDVYVTVGTEEKRAYLKKNYPQLLDSHIGNSRDISFEQMIKRETKNRGVDLVLNSLSDEKLQASIRCLAHRGQFMEIGKYDLGNDTSFNLLFMEKEASYHGIVLDVVFKHVKEIKSQLVELIEEGIKFGFVKPLPRVIFNADQIEESYRYMMTGKHVGKILIKLRDEDKNKVETTNGMQIKATPRFNCDVRCSYVIIGGLGGVGLELADWLVLRGARKLLLVSRSGLQNGYQRQRIRIWKSYGVEVKISTKDASIEQQCDHIIKEANDLGPVDAIFNLGVVLKDALFEDQTKENFIVSLAPKAQVTIHLDRSTRKFCPNLRYFVIFSSVSCGRGNAGQSNYGMANSIMERICENRKREGLPAVAIQWGAIGEVGLVAKMQKEHKELVIGGTLQQKISSCLEVLDTLLKQDHPVVSSMVVAEKHTKSDGLSPVEAVAKVLGIKNMKTISQYVTLTELGMDSMMGTEIIQLLEKDYEIYITSKDVRSLTFAKLIEIEAERLNNAEERIIDKLQEGTNLLIQHIPSSEKSQLPIMQLNSQIESSNSAPVVFMLPGIEGVFKPLEILTNNIKSHIVGIHYSYKNPENSIPEIAESIFPNIENYLCRDLPFVIIGYSFGGVVSLELTKLLEHKGYHGTIICIDSSPTYLISVAEKHFGHSEEEAEFETEVVIKIFSFLMPINILLQQKEMFLKCKDFDERFNLALTLIPSKNTSKRKIEKQAVITLYKRLKAITSYKFMNKKIKSLVHLFKVKYPIVEEDDDYQLSKMCEHPVEVTMLEGDHVTILSDSYLAEAVNKIISLKL